MMKREKFIKQELSNSYLSAYSNKSVGAYLNQLYNAGGLSLLVVILRQAFKELHHVELKLAALLQEMEAQNAQNKHGQIKPMPIGGEAHFDGKWAIVESTFVGSLGEKALVTTRRELSMRMIQLLRDQLM